MNNFEELMEFLHARAHRDEDCGCLVWKGAFTQGVCKMRTTEVKGGTTQNVRRLILSLRSKTPLSRKDLATSTCGNQRCVEPDHIRRATRKQIQQRTSAEGKFHAPHVLAARRIQGTKRARVTPELARQIRDRVNDGETYRQIGESLGLSMSVIGKVYRGAIGANAVPNSSVFTWRSAA